MDGLAGEEPNERQRQTRLASVDNPKTMARVLARSLLLESITRLDSTTKPRDSDFRSMPRLGAECPGYGDPETPLRG